MPSNETPGAIASREPDGAGSDGGIDPRLAEALIEAIVAYPTFATACAACGQTDKAVKSLLERGVQVGAPRSLREFSKRFALADAENARTHQEVAQKLLGQGNAAGARLVYQIIEKRWMTNGELSVMAMLTSGRQTANLRARLERPSPMLAALLTGMMKAPNGAWQKLLQGAGWVRAMAEESEPAEESAPGSEAESAPEEQDGSGD